jgi:hypothetical protein
VRYAPCGPPELFSAPTLERIQRRFELREIDAVPHDAGLMSGEHEALIQAFAGEPILHDPRRGRVIGVAAFEAYVERLSAWLAERRMTFDAIEHASPGPRGFEEVTLHLDGAGLRVDAPVAIVAQRDARARLVELRLYHSIWALTGAHLHRPPLLQRDPRLGLDGIVAQYVEALAAGDVDALLATFEPDGWLREPAGDPYVHRGHDALRAFFTRWLALGGVALEACALVADGPLCALEYNVVGWGGAELEPEAGVAVFAPGQSGRLAAVRLYDDADYRDRSHRSVAARPSA